MSRNSFFSFFTRYISSLLLLFFNHQVSKLLNPPAVVLAFFFPSTACCCSAGDPFGCGVGPTAPPPDGSLGSVVTWPPLPRYLPTPGPLPPPSAPLAAGPG